MATGYTSIFEEKDISFEEFTWRSARAMGAFIMQRDDATDVPCRRPEPSSYHRDALANAQAELKQLKKMTAEEAKAIADAEFNKLTQAMADSKLKRAALKARYEKALKAVQAWNPPTKSHEGLKRFMTEQLETSIDWDCREYNDVPKRQTGAEYLAAREKVLLHDIEYHGKKMEEEAKQQAELNTWIDQLVDSVPPPWGRF